VRSTGIREERFEVDGAKLLVVDVGGQRSERKKWMHLFEDSKLVIFVAAISEYDQVSLRSPLLREIDTELIPRFHSKFLYEDESQPRISEALMLWESIATSPWLRKASFVLFLNKRDLLEEKIRANPESIRTYLPDYLGPLNDIEAIKHYFLVRFTALQRNKERSLFTSFTCVSSDILLLDSTWASTDHHYTTDTGN
jgi:hypothetical protein